MRRLGRYSQESFEAAKKLLNSYLLNREYREAFAKHPDLHREVLQHLAYLTQAQHLQPLEKLVQWERKRRARVPASRLAQAVAFLEENQEELPYFYPDLFRKCCHLFDQILLYPYFKKLLAKESPPASSFRQRVWQLLRRGEELMAQMKQQHCWIEEEALRGTPFPMIVSAPSPPASPNPG